MGEQTFFTRKMGGARPSAKTLKTGISRKKTVLPRSRSKLDLPTGKIATKRVASRTQKRGESLAQIGLTTLAEQVFGKDAVGILKKNNFSARDIWEMSTPTTQCNNTIGAIEYGKTECWICGLVIKDKAECEHVLPIAQAAIFLSLYSSRHDPEKQRHDISVEYGWAHSVCNQEKGDTSGILYRGENLGINSVAIQTILGKIYKSNRSKVFKDELHKKYKTLEIFKKKRIEPASEKYSEIIDGFIGAPDNKPLVNLFVMAGYALLEDTSTINPKTYDILFNKESLKENMKLLDEERIKTIREYLGLSEAADGITKKTDVLVKMEKSLLKKIEKNITKYIGPYGYNLTSVSTNIHSLDFLERVFLRYGNLKRDSDVKKMIEVTSDFLTQKYFQTIFEKTNNSRFEKLKTRLKEGIVDFTDNIKKNGISLEELDEEYELYSSGEFQVTMEDIQSASKSMSVDRSVEDAKTALLLLKGDDSDLEELMEAAGFLSKLKQASRSRPSASKMSD